MTSNITDSHTAEIRAELAKLIGTVTAKKLFIGYGLFYERSLMFGIYLHETKKFYVRAEGELAEYVLSLGAKQWPKGGDGSEPSSRNYYSLPDEVRKDTEIYQRILIKSINVLREQRVEEEILRKSRLRDLVNLSLKYERILAKVGVTSVNMFQSLGAAACYLRLLKADIRVSERFFLILTAALKNKHVDLLTESEKKKAFKQLETCFANANFKLKGKK